MTLIEVIDRARALLNAPLDATRTFPDNSSGHWQDTTLANYFNLIQDEMQDEIVSLDEGYFVTSTFVSIVNGTAEYLLPSGTIKVIRLEDARSNPPTEIEPISINSRDQYPLIATASAVRGGGYYLRGNYLVLDATPNFTNASAVQLYFVRKLTDITAATGVSDLPPHLHGVIVWGVVHLAHFSRESDDSTAEKMYEKGKNRMKKTLEQRQTQKSRTVKRTGVNV